MLPIIRVPEILAKGMESFRKIFCRAEGFDQVAPQLTVVMLPLPFPVVVSAWVDVLGVWVPPKGAGGP